MYNIGAMRGKGVQRRRGWQGEERGRGFDLKAQAREARCGCP